MFVNRILFRVDCCNDRRSEKRDSLNGNVVQQEDETDYQCGWSEDSLLDRTDVHLIKYDNSTNLLRLDSTGGKVLFLLRQPSGLFRPVRHQEIRCKTNDGSDDSFNQENLLPCVYLADTVYFQDTRRE